MKPPQLRHSNPEHLATRVSPDRRSPDRPRRNGLPVRSERQEGVRDQGLSLAGADARRHLLGDWGCRIEQFQVGLFEGRLIFRAHADGSIKYSLWTYNPINNDTWGDSWNGENFSWFSLSDRTPEALAAVRDEPEWQQLNVCARVLDAVEVSSLYPARLSNRLTRNRSSLAPLRLQNGRHPASMHLRPAHPPLFVRIHQPDPSRACSCRRCSAIATDASGTGQAACRWRPVRGTRDRDLLASATVRSSCARRFAPRPASGRRWRMEVRRGGESGWTRATA